MTTADQVKSPEKADFSVRHLLASGLSIKIGREVEKRKSMARSIFGFDDVDHKIDRTEQLSRKLSENQYVDILPKRQSRN